MLKIFICNFYTFLWFYKLIFYTCLAWKVSVYMNVQWNIWRRVIRHSEWCVWGCICSKLALRRARYGKHGRRFVETMISQRYCFWIFYSKTMGIFLSFSSSHGYGMYRVNWIKTETYRRYTLSTIIVLLEIAYRIWHFLDTFLRVQHSVLVIIGWLKIKLFSVRDL